MEQRVREIDGERKVLDRVEEMCATLGEREPNLKELCAREFLAE